MNFCFKFANAQTFPPVINIPKVSSTDSLKVSPSSSSLSVDSGYQMFSPDPQGDSSILNPNQDQKENADLPESPKILESPGSSDLSDLSDLSNFSDISNLSELSQSSEDYEDLDSSENSSNSEDSGNEDNLNSPSGSSSSFKAPREGDLGTAFNPPSTFNEVANPAIFRLVLENIQSLTKEEALTLVQNKFSGVHPKKIKGLFEWFSPLEIKDFLILAQKTVPINALIQLKKIRPDFSVKDALDLLSHGPIRIAQFYQNNEEHLPPVRDFIKILQKGIHAKDLIMVYEELNFPSHSFSLEEISDSLTKDLGPEPYRYANLIQQSQKANGEDPLLFLTPKIVAIHRMAMLMQEGSKIETFSKAFSKTFPQMKLEDMMRLMIKGLDLEDAAETLSRFPSSTLDDILNFQYAKGYLSHLDKMKKAWNISHLQEATEFLKKGGNMCSAALLKETFPHITLEDYFQFGQINPLPIGPALLKKEGFQFSFEDYLEFEKLGGDPLKIFQNKSAWKSLPFSKILDLLRNYQMKKGLHQGLATLAGPSTSLLESFPSSSFSCKMVNEGDEVRDEGMGSSTSSSPSIETILKLTNADSGPLNEEDKNFIARYTGNYSYGAMNRQYRCPSLDSQSDIDTWNLSLGLEKALGKLKSSPRKTYRGFGLAPSWVFQYQPGTIISESSFLSTSELKKKAFDFSKGLLYSIKGRSGIDIHAYSTLSSEKEFLFPPQTKYRVNSFKPFTHKKRWPIFIIELEEIED